MPALTSAWRLLRRFLGQAETQPADEGQNNGGLVGWCNSLVASSRTGSRRLREFRAQLREGQHHSQLAWAEVMREDRRAKRRSLTLLLKLLNAQQRQEFREAGHFLVTGGTSGERYRIRTDRIANIDVLHDDGTVKCRLCVIPTGGVPIYDVMAAQLLHLQDPATELRLLKQANVFPVEKKSAFSRSAWIS